MRILFTIPHVTIGGAQRVCINLINWLQNKDNEVLLLIYSRKETGGFKYDLAGINHRYLSAKGTYNKIVEIRKLTKYFKPDVFVSFGVPNCLFDIPATIGLNTKKVVCERNDPAHFAGRLSTKIVSRLLMRLADGYVFQTKDAQRYYGGNMARHSVIIPNPLLFSEESENTSIPLVRDKTIVTTGRLNKQKNHPLLIRAFNRISKQFPEYKLIIYGEGEERLDDEKLILDLGLQNRVILPGSINNVLNTIRTASLFVLSSDFEGMPNSLMEAMAVGLPCISTDCPCGGPRDIIDNNMNAVLVPVGDELSMSQAMIELLSNQNKAKFISKEAMKIKDKLSIDNIGIKWLNYFQMLNNRK